MWTACPVDQRRSIDGDEDMNVGLMRVLVERAEGPPTALQPCRETIDLTFSARARCIIRVELWLECNLPNSSHAPMRRQTCNDFVGDTGCRSVTLRMLKYANLLIFPCAGVTPSRVNISSAEFSALFCKAVPFWGLHSSQSWPCILACRMQAMFRRVSNQYA